MPKWVFSLLIIGDTNMDDRWLSIEEIGEFLGVKRDTVNKWIKEREMPAHKIGRSWKFQKDEVNEWVRSGKAGEHEA